MAKAKSIINDIITITWGNITGTLTNQTDLNNALEKKQNNLTTDQLNACNSGITSLKVQAYDNLDSQKQDSLTDSQLQVLETGISTQDVSNWNNKQDSITLIEGFDPTKNQYLKNIGGTLKWITEA